MAGLATSRETLRAFKIQPANLTINVGDDILLRPPEGVTNPCIAKVAEIFTDRQGNVKIKGQWYYWHEDTTYGRHDFHGVKELYLSNHFDDQWPQSVDGKCRVHTLKDYKKLSSVEPEDFFRRMEYDYQTGHISPIMIKVLCVCDKPYNPDLRMIGCDRCKSWYHCGCVGISLGEANARPRFICTLCRAEIRNAARSGEGNPSKRPRVGDQGAVFTSGLPIVLKKMVESYMDL